MRDHGDAGGRRRVARRTWPWATSSSAALLHVGGSRQPRPARCRLARQRGMGSGTIALLEKAAVDCRSCCPVQAAGRSQFFGLRRAITVRSIEWQATMALPGRRRCETPIVQGHRLKALTATERGLGRSRSRCASLTVDDGRVGRGARSPVIMRPDARAAANAAWQPEAQALFSAELRVRRRAERPTSVVTRRDSGRRARRHSSRTFPPPSPTVLGAVTSVNSSTSRIYLVLASERRTRAASALDRVRSGMIVPAVGTEPAAQVGHGGQRWCPTRWRPTTVAAIDAARASRPSVGRRSSDRRREKRQRCS